MVGRPHDDIKHEAFLALTKCLRSNDSEQMSINYLVRKMKEFLPDDVESYGFTHMKENIIQHFGSQKIISEADGNI